MNLSLTPRLRFAFVLLMALVVVNLFASVQARAQRSGGGQSEPRFTDYPAGAKFTGRPARAVLRDRQARMFRTRLKEGAQAGPNFAGHYTVVRWGCGSGCIEMAVVDARTGVIYWPPFSNVVVGMSGTVEDNPSFNIASKLMVVRGALNEQDNDGVYYYVFDKNRFRLVKYVKGESPAH